GEAIARAVDEVPNARARAGVERVEDLVELDDPAGLLERQRRARLQGATRPAGLELQVLQPERRARADRHDGVGAQRLDRLLQLQVELRHEAARRGLDRLDA